MRRPAGMDGEDLSPLFDADVLPERPYAYGGYFNHFYVRSGLPPYYEGAAVARVKR